MPSTVFHVTGARPNFPKAAPVLAALAENSAIRQVLIHTGQHYDDQMSAVFFRQLGLPHPDVNLGVGPGSHASQTGAIMMRFEELLAAGHPDMVVVYGDVNSTLAVTLVAAKSGVPVAHVEAGLRSFDRSMPEEVNRLVTDRLSDVLLATSADAVAHLAAEGTPAAHIHLVGNPMIDTLMKHLPAATSERTDAYGLPDRYAVATLHRPANVDAPAELKLLVDALHEVATTSLPVAIPVHPRGKHRLDEAGMFEHPEILELPPLGYLEFITLMRQSTLVITDSGGVQEETTILGIPCFTVRPNTERPITITHGTNRLSPPDRLAAEVRAQAQAGRPTSWRTPPLWDGLAGRRIADVLLDYLESGH